MSGAEVGLGVRVGGQVKRGERVRIQHKGDIKWKDSRKQMDMADRALRAVQELAESLPNMQTELHAKP